jgi:hypothetical protein
MDIERRIEQLEQCAPQPPDECITVNAGDDYSVSVPVSLLPTIERIYGVHDEH